MAQKKAFVRYAANKAVPGSLIVRTKAPKVGTWKEVPYDLCCGTQTSLSNVILTETTTIPENQSLLSITLSSEECSVDLNFSIPLTTDFLNYNELVAFLNTNFSFLGLFTYTAPTTISLQLSSVGYIGYYSNSCPSSSSWLFNVSLIGA